jgi:hypothetical protein
MKPTVPEMQPTLRLADHVRACTLSDQVVLLDLRRSRYLSLSLTRWAHLTGGAADNATAATRTTPDLQPLPWVESLLRQGLLTRLPASGGPRGEPLPAATESLDAGPTPCASIGAGPALRLVAAAAWSSAALRLRSLHHIANRVTDRSARIRTAPPDQGARLRSAIAAFEAMRPLVLSARERCLNDSLALVTFLASEGIAARWVIGVRTQPFGAHAWVQSGAHVLNDLHENVRSFQPILVV